MKRLRYAAIFVLAFCLVALLLSGPAQADHQQILPGVPTKIMKRAMERGYLTYRYDEATAAYPNFKAQTTAVLTEHLAKFGIEYREIFEGTPDVWFVMPEDLKYLGQCGDGSAGCITYANDPVVVAYRRALLFADYGTVIGHELAHLLGLHEQYYDSGGQFRCRPLAEMPYPSVMSCGTGIKTLQPVDVALTRGLMVPLPIQGFYGMSYLPDRVEGYYCGADAVRGTRTAVMAIAPDGTAYWSGLHLPVGPGCFSFRIVGDPGWCYAVLAENGFSWRVGAQRHEAKLGCL